VIGIITVALVYPSSQSIIIMAEPVSKMLENHLILTELIQNTNCILLKSFKSNSMFGN